MSPNWTRDDGTSDFDVDVSCAACIRCLGAPEFGIENPVVCRMVLCATCGNKRCPKATDHRNECTGSNEPGQPGSCY